MPNAEMLLVPVLATYRNVLLTSTIRNDGCGVPVVPVVTTAKGDPVSCVNTPEVVLNAEPSLDPLLAEYTNDPVESTATAAGAVPAEKGDPATAAGAPPAMLKLAILLFAESAAYKNCPLESIARPATVAPAPTVTGDPPSSASVPLAAIEKEEIVPEAPLETYRNPAVGETIRNCGFGATRDANGNGDPATGVNKPRVASMLKTEMEAGTAGEAEP